MRVSGRAEMSSRVSTWRSCRGGILRPSGVALGTSRNPMDREVRFGGKSAKTVELEDGRLRVGRRREVRVCGKIWNASLVMRCELYPV